MSNKKNQSENQSTGLTVQESSVGIEKIDAATLNSLLTEQGFELEPYVSLKEEGDSIRGHLYGEAPPVEIPNPVTGEVAELAAFRIQLSSGQTVRLFGGVGLSKNLRGIADGTEVVVIRAPQERTRRGQMVTVYHVAIRR